ncbi:cysteine-rich repeat secretory protein 38-like, partial [Telopea speciosissima]|uniref:cysteine-rich repeat secretory protein 38-like n=1 Tax=Telopea speciosissima TaxID=54955 RepID=UPI001CC62F64
LNVQFLLSLSSNATSGTGFYIADIGDGSDKVYGQFLCRGDITPEDCQTCVGNASEEIKPICTNMISAIAWYDNCMIRYSNVSFFSILQGEPFFHYFDQETISELDQYNQTVRDLMDQLRKEAAYGSTTPKYYAAGEEKYYTGNDIVYGLVQCNPNITQVECSDCLNGSISLDVPKLLYPYKAGKILKPSCNIRYQFNNPFYRQAITDGNVASGHSAGYQWVLGKPLGVTPLSLYLEIEAGKGRSWTLIIVIIVVVIVATFIAIIVISILYLRVRRRKQKLKVEGPMLAINVGLILGALDPSIVTGSGSSTTSMESLALTPLICIFYLEEDDKIEITNVDSLQFNLDTIRAATDNFSEANKLGQGGFGAVYKF